MRKWESSILIIKKRLYLKKCYLDLLKSVWVLKSATILKNEHFSLKKLKIKTKKPYINKSTKPLFLLTTPFIDSRSRFWLLLPISQKIAQNVTCGQDAIVIYTSYQILLTAVRRNDSTPYTKPPPLQNHHQTPVNPKSGSI